MAGGEWSPVNFLRFLLIGWRQPHIQHDAAEFIQFLMPRLGDGFSWGARIQVEGQVEEFLRSGNTRILLMVTPDGLCSSDIQQFINQWHEQARTHALHSAPKHMYTQLPRYRETPSGIVKHTIPLDLHRKEIMLPVFTSQANADVSWKIYDITTAIIHLGPNQNSGHYRVAAFTPDHTNCWYSNDNQVAERMSVIPEEIKEESYILGCLTR